MYLQGTQWQQSVWPTFPQSAFALLTATVYWCLDPLWQEDATIIQRYVLCTVRDRVASIVDALKMQVQLTETGKLYTIWAGLPILNRQTENMVLNQSNLYIYNLGLRMVIALHSTSAASANATADT